MLIDIELEGLDTLLKAVGLYGDNRIAQQLFNILNGEKACRETDSINKDVLVIDGANATVEELKEIAGLAYGLCTSIDAEQYPRTVLFTYTLLEGILVEIEAKKPITGPVH